MIFWPLLLMAALLIGAIVASPQAQGGPVTPEDAWRIYMTAVAAVILVGGTLRLLVRGGRSGLVGASLCLGVLATAVTAYSFREELRNGWTLARGQMVPSMALSHRAGEVELRRAWDGHYRADAHVNGQPVRMMVDTGASMVLLPYERVAELGIPPRSLRFTVPVTTANGRSSVAPLHISSLRIGPIVVRDVEAAVARPGRLQSPLLGMSFLERLDETTFRDDRLILRKRSTTGGRDTLFIAAPRAD